MKWVGDWGTIIDEVEAEMFVGREQALDDFHRSINLSRPDYLIFYITGQGGVGKTVLLNRYRKVAEESGFLVADTDELQRTIPAVLGRFASQLAVQGFPLKRFEERYKTYRQKVAEIESDPEAPQGLASLLGRAVVHATYISGDLLPGIRKGLDYLPRDALETQASEWTSYLAKKLTNRDEIALVREPTSILTSLFYEDLNEVAQKRKILLCFENFDATQQELQDWFLHLREYKPSVNIRIAIAGRNLPGASWDVLRRITKVIRLDVFTEQESLAFLDASGITNVKRRREILRWSDRLPVLMSWLAAPEGEEPDPSIPTQDIVERFLRWVTEPALRQVALLAAIPPTFDLDILKLLLEQEHRSIDAQAAFDWLLTMPFVQQHSNGWRYHDVVRHMMLQYQRRRSSQTYRQIHSILADFYNSKRIELHCTDEEQWAHEQWLKDTLAYIYHFLAADPNAHWEEVMNLFAMAVRKNRAFAIEIAESLIREDFLDDLTGKPDNKRSGDTGGRIYMLDQLGMVAKEQGQYEEAKLLYSKALAVLVQLGDDQARRPKLLYRLGDIALEQGQYEEAKLLYEESFAIQERLEDQNGLMITLLQLGIIASIQEQYEEAKLLCDKSLAIAGRLGDLSHRASTLHQLGKIAYLQNQYEQAQELYEESLAIIDRLGDIRGRTSALIQLGMIAQNQGQYQKAQNLYEESLTVALKLGDQYRQAVALHFLGAIAQERRLYKEALRLYEESLDRETNYLDPVISLNDLGLLLQEMGDIAAAQLCFKQILRILKDSPVTTDRRSVESKITVQKVLNWLQAIIQDMEIVQTSHSILIRTSALNRAISTLVDVPQELDYFSQIRRQLVKRIIDRWHEIITRDASRIGKIAVSEYIRSPYIFTPPVIGKALIGRDDIFDRITSLWAWPGQRNSLLIHGHRRMGKTSVAQALVSRCNFGDDTQLVYLSLEGQPLHQEGNLYQLLSSRIWLRLKKLMDKAKVEDFFGENTHMNFDFFLAQLNEVVGNVRLVLVLDEFEMLYNRLGAAQANEIIAYLRAQTVTYPWLALALVGLSDLDDLRLSYNSSILGWEGIRVSFLDAEQVKNMLANPPQDPDFPLDYTLEALEMVAQLTNGQPYLVQVIGDRLVQRYNRIVFTEQQEHSGVFDVNDVQAVLEDPGFYSTAAAYFDGVWEQATKGQPGEVPLLTALAGYESSMSETTLRVTVNLDDIIFAQALLALERHDVLCHQDGKVCYTVPLMCRWVRETHLHDGSQRTGVTYG